MVPATRNANRATTLISAAQNSNSPNNATDTMFMANTRARAMSAMSHCGTDPKTPQNLA